MIYVSLQPFVFVLFNAAKACQMGNEIYGGQTNHEIESVYNTRDGQSLNVHRYSSFPKKAKPSDVRRAANTRKFLQNKEVKLVRAPIDAIYELYTI